MSHSVYESLKFVPHKLNANNRVKGDPNPIIKWLFVVCFYGVEFPDFPRGMPFPHKWSILLCLFVAPMELGKLDTLFILSVIGWSLGGWVGMCVVTTVRVSNSCGLFVFVCSH